MLASQQFISLGGAENFTGFHGLDPASLCGNISAFILYIIPLYISLKFIVMSDVGWDKLVMLSDESLFSFQFLVRVPIITTTFS